MKVTKLMEGPNGEHGHGFNPTIWPQLVEQKDF